MNLLHIAMAVSDNISHSFNSKLNNLRILFVREIPIYLPLSINYDLIITVLILKFYHQHFNTYKLPIFFQLISFHLLIKISKIVLHTVLTFIKDKY
jgi:hypothetical protein